MSIKKRLSNVALSGVLAFCLSGCVSDDPSGNSPRSYNSSFLNDNSHNYASVFGKRDEMRYQILNFNNGSLRVLEKNGVVVEYFDSDKDLKLDRMEVLNHGRRMVYESGVASKKTMRDGQFKFDQYLSVVRSLKRQMR